MSTIVLMEAFNPKSQNLPPGLPATFSYREALGHGVPKGRLYRLRDAGLIQNIGRGLFTRAGEIPEADPDLIEVARRAPLATLCLTTALAHHDLTDAIPVATDVALPRGHRFPKTQSPVHWHAFAVDTFDIGKRTLQLTDQLSVGLYGPERSVIDAFRLRHLLGPETAAEALRRWLRRPRAQPSTLLTMAQHFPKAEPALRGALEILL